MLPTKRGEMGEHPVWNRFGLTQGGDSVRQVPRVPKDDGGDEEVETGSPVLLVLVCAVAYLAQAVDEDRPRQAVARLPLFNSLTGRAAQFVVAGSGRG